MTTGKMINLWLNDKTKTFKRLRDGSLNVLKTNSFGILSWNDLEKTPFIITTKYEWEEVVDKCSFLEAIEWMEKSLGKNIAIFNSIEYAIKDKCMVTDLNSKLENYTLITTDMIHGKWYIKK